MHPLLSRDIASKALCKPYASLTSSEVFTFVREVKEAEKSGFIEFSFYKVMDERLVPWDPALSTYECRLRLGPASEFSSAEDDSLRLNETVGAGSAYDLKSGFCHAFSEAIERLSISAHKDFDVRPSLRHVYSLLEQSWLELPYNPLIDSKLNRDFSRSGEAFHIKEEQAITHALCEVIERANLVATIRAHSDVELFDITQYAIATNQSAQSANAFWKSKDYCFRVLMMKSQYRIWSILVTATANSPNTVIQGVRGSSARFDLQSAITQAVTESGRYYCYGVPRNLDRETLDQRLENPQRKTDHQRLLLFRDATPLRRIGNRVEGVLTDVQIQSILEEYHPSKILNCFENDSQDVWIIPVARDPFKIRGFSYKVICPGWDQTPNFWGDSTDELGKTLSGSQD